MSVILKMKDQEANPPEEQVAIQAMIASAANIAAPVWPLRTFIACNPLQGFESLSFEEAVAKAGGYKEMNSQPMAEREAVNRETIKWLSAFVDDGQSTIRMPSREHGFYRTFADLARFDNALRKDQTIAPWLANLPPSPEAAITESFNRLGIAEADREEFIRQSLSALPGWSGYVKWNSDWRNGVNRENPISLADYLAVRLILTCVFWPNAKVFDVSPLHAPIVNAAAEEQYRHTLIKKLLPEATNIGSYEPKRPDAQLVFCIDVRSEPFRRSLETTGSYQTLGFAGFFGLPIKVKPYDDEEAHDSCPVLLKPSHEICEHPTGNHDGEVERHDGGRSLLNLPKSFYQSLKYNFTTPFALVEMLGPWLGLRMFSRTFLPQLTASIKTASSGMIMPDIHTAPVLDGITIAQQADYGEGSLRMMGLTENIAPIVVFCGHGSATQNNAYAAALDCGACGGNRGGINARILAAILNKDNIRSILAARGLVIPNDTLFIAGEHDTTTDHVELCGIGHLDKLHQDAIGNLRQHLDEAKQSNAAARCATFGRADEPKPVKATLARSRDWAQPRPEWGLARNAAFIIGPRELTRGVNLEGRCFLHSYDWQNDPEGKFLTVILTAPMVVAQWINSQYLFSTLDNVSYGGGSKVTKNVIGKIGIMQGNASDLMHGLPLQSVFAADDKPYHEALRLMTVVYAPRSMIESIIHKQEVLQKLLGNGWVTLLCIEPSESRAYFLQRDFTWQIVH